MPDLTSDSFMELLMSRRPRGHHTYEIQRLARSICDLLLSQGISAPSWDVIITRLNAFTSSEQIAIRDARQALGDDRCSDLYKSFIATRAELLCH